MSFACWLFQGGNCEIDSKNDVKDFADLHSAMDVLAFSAAEKETIYKILASVLHIGNVYFSKVQVCVTYAILPTPPKYRCVSHMQCLLLHMFGYSKLQTFFIFMNRMHCMKNIDKNEK